MLTIRTYILLGCVLMTTVTAALGLFTLHGEQRIAQLARNTYDQALTSMSFVREAAAKFESLRSRYALAMSGGGTQAGTPEHFDAVTASTAFDDIVDELDSVTERAAPGPAREATFALRQRFTAMSKQAGDVAGTVSRLSDAAVAFHSVIEQYSQESFDFRLHEEKLITVAIRSTWLALAAALVMAIGITVGLSHSIVPGLRRAIQAASAIADGHLDEAIPIGRSGRNETSILLRALVRMQTATKQQLVRIRALHSEAEATQSAVVTGLAEGLRRLAIGDLTFRLEHSFAAEYEQIKTDFNDAANQLQQMIRGIASNAAAINAGTNQIAHAADDLSRRSEQQAKRLQQTTLAMDGIAARVRETASGAQHASQIVSQTKADAEQSEAVVGRAALAMTTIEQSSQQITQIIGVINDLAAQTRLLALNAGIEASRAGDAGRSFAVVASEVRALAQRSAQAAKQIKSLISASNDRVGEGVTMVAEAAAALRRIMAQVGQINTVVGGIAASNRDQSASLQEIHASILMMDQVTQQNTAMVEASNAASHALARETGALLSLTTRFRANNGNDASPADPTQEVDGSDLELFG